MNIFELNGLPSEENPYLFNGDFVDRGSFSVECIFVLFGFKLLYPNHFFMSRGNHESENMNKMYGFEGEVKSKYSSNMVDLFTEVYNWLPLCHCINNRILVMHGGLFSKVNTHSSAELKGRIFLSIYALLAIRLLIDELKIFTSNNKCRKILSVTNMQFCVHLVPLRTLKIKLSNIASITKKH